MKYFYRGVVVVVLAVGSQIFLRCAESQTTQESMGQGASSGSRPPTVSAKEGKEHLIKPVYAPYPPIARAAHVSGTVVVGAEIDTNGDVTQVVVLGGPHMLESAAVDAVKQYKYRPFLINGTPAVVRTAVQVTFSPGHMRSN